MNKRVLLILCMLLAGLLALAACGAPLPPAKTGMIAQPATSGGPKVSNAAQQFANLKGDAGKGKTKFTGTCASCHGESATGMAGLGKDLTSSTFTKGLSNADFLLFVTKGRPSSDKANTTGVDMPPRGGNPALSNQDLADIISFVRTLEKK